MFARLTFIGVTLFWVTMNVLLWQSEFRGKNELGSRVPVSVVWQKMLIAPDDSNLDILQQGKKIGSFRWSPNVGEELATGKTAAPDGMPEGRIQKLSGYTIDIAEGVLTLEEARKRILFNFNARFSTNHQWQDFTLHFNQRPSIYELHGNAVTQTLGVSVKENNFDWNRTFTFAELREPEKLLQEFTGPVPLGLLAGGLTAGLGVAPGKGMEFDLNWEANHDWLQIGHSHLRVYRLHTRLGNRYDLVVYVSRVGEILRVDLPNGMRLLNSRLDM